MQSTGRENEVLLDENLNESEFLTVECSWWIAEDHPVPDSRTSFPFLPTRTLKEDSPWGA